MVKPEIRQWYGPSPHHQRACVELSFASDSRQVSLSSIHDELERDGHSLSGPLTDGDLDFPEAIGVLACALLSKYVSPEWSCGRDGDLSWVCLSHTDPRMAEAALIASHKAALSCVGTGSDLPAEFLRLAANPPAVDYETALMRRAASELGLDTLTVCQFPHVFQIGAAASGVHFHVTANQLDSYTGAVLAGDKRATIQLLSRLRLPTTRPLVARAADQVEELVRRVGFPCVIKPLHGAWGEGVTTRIGSFEQVEKAVRHATGARGFPLLIENHVEGHDHRLTVANGQLLWAYRKTPAHVVGDGETTVRELVVQENSRRRELSLKNGTYLKEISLGVERETFVRDQYGIELDSVVPAGQKVVLAGTANISQGALLDDVTCIVHPDNRLLAIQVAKLFRINVIGIDFITPDITRSWQEVPSAIIEINCTPGFSGAGDALFLVRALLPNRLSGRVPSFVVIGDKAYREYIRGPLLKALRDHRLVTGIADYAERTGVARQGSNVRPFVQAMEVEAILLDPRAEAVVIFCEEDRVESSGFPLERCDVLFAADAAKLPTAKVPAERIVGGQVDADLLARAVLEVIEPYLDVNQGGPRPTIEWQGEGHEAEADRSTFSVRCWRFRAIPRDWFWSQVPAGQKVTEGMIGCEDVLTAITAFAGEHLHQSGASSATIEFSLTPSMSSKLPWDAAHLDAEIVFHPVKREIARDALIHGVKAVNNIVDFRA